METTVATDIGERVYNVGRMQAQLIVIIASMGVFIGGVVLLAVGGFRSWTK